MPKRTNSPRRQHFNPIAALKPFADERKKVYRLLKNDFDVEPHLISIHKVCTERDIYTVPFAVDPYFVEDYLEKNYDARYHTVYDLVINHKAPTLNPVERKSLIYWMVSMVHRSQAYRDFLLKADNDRSFAMYDNIVSGRISDDKKFSSIWEGLDEAGAKKKLAEWNSQLTPMKVISRIEADAENTFNRHWISVVQLVGHSEFLTSDNAVTIDNVRHPDATEFLSIALPIDSKHLLRLRPNDGEYEIYKLHRKIIHEDSESRFGYMENRLQFKQCLRYLLGTKKGLEDFRSQHKQDTTF